MSENYIIVQGKEFGPFSDEEIADMAKSARNMVVVSR